MSFIFLFFDFISAYYPGLSWSFIICISHISGISRIFSGIFFMLRYLTFSFSRLLISISLSGSSVRLLWLKPRFCNRFSLYICSGICVNLFLLRYNYFINSLKIENYLGIVYISLSSKLSFYNIFSSKITFGNSFRCKL